MHLSTLSWSVVAIALAAAAVPAFGGRATTGQEQHSPCTEDARIVFDASGSMSGNGWGYGSETAGVVSRIDKVRSTLAKILPKVTRSRRVGLITYGPGVWNQCNVHLDLSPTEHAAGRIMTAVYALTPAGKTPLTEAVSQAAKVLDFREQPGLIVALTDGEETCGGSPCNLGEQLSAEACKKGSEFLERSFVTPESRHAGKELSSLRPSSAISERPMARDKVLHLSGQPEAEND